MEGVDLPHPLIWKIWKKRCLSYLLIYHIKHIIHQFLALFLWYVFSV